MKTAIIGASGFVGSNLWRSYKKEHPDCIGTAFSNSSKGHTFFDLRYPDLAKLNLEKTGHEAVIIASAKPNIAYCENEAEQAFLVNVKGTLSLIKQLVETKIKIFFLSSDYVFDGKKGLYDDWSSTNPTTEYGRQKEIVEKEIPKLTDNYQIIRLSKIYGLEKGDGTLLVEMAENLLSNKKMRLAKDQFFSPTYVKDVIQIIKNIQKRSSSKIINIAAPIRISRLEVAQHLGKQMKADPSLIEAISLHDIQSMKNRPLDTSLCCSYLNKCLRPIFTPWKDILRRIDENYC